MTRTAGQMLDALGTEAGVLGVLDEIEGAARKQKAAPTAAVKATTRKAPAKEAAPAKAAPTRLDPEKCSGKWSRCGGANPRKSPSWGICVECTENRAKEMKTAKEAAHKPTPISSAKSARKPAAAKTPVARNAPPKPSAPVASVAAMVAPEVEVKKV